MKLVIGLGNPGRKYHRTRHNVGFAVLEELARRHGGHGGAKAAFQGEVQEARFRGARLLLLWPHTFMNRSGGAVLAARDFYKLSHDELLVVCDDFNLPLGRLRIRNGGSSGGQKGLDDIICRLADDQLPRLRLGVGPVPAGRDAADFVLSRFAGDEESTIGVATVLAADAVETWAEEGIEQAMNKYNGLS